MINLNDPPYLAWLEPLLPERKELRLLLSELLRLRRCSREAEALKVSQQMESLVYGPLHLNKLDVKSGYFFEQILGTLLARYNSSWEVWEDLSLAWQGTLVPNIVVDVHPPLKNRLTDLCGPLDELIAAKRAELA